MLILIVSMYISLDNIILDAGNIMVETRTAQASTAPGLLRPSSARMIITGHAAEGTITITRRPYVISTSHLCDEQ